MEISKPLWLEADAAPLQKMTKEQVDGWNWLFGNVDGFTVNIISNEKWEEIYHTARNKNQEILYARSRYRMGIEDSFVYSLSHPSSIVMWQGPWMMDVPGSASKYIFKNGRVIGFVQGENP